MEQTQLVLYTIPSPSRAAVNSCGYLKVSWGEIAAEIFELTITVSSSYKGSPQVTPPMQPKWHSHTIKALRVFHIWSAIWSLTTGSLAVWLQGMRTESIYTLLSVIQTET